MWIWDLWRWLCGFVTFRAEGGLCERFFHLLRIQSPAITLWDVSREDGAMTACCRVSDYARLRPFARRTGTRVRVVKKHGSFLYWRPLLKRPGLLIGAVLTLTLYLLLASRIWVIDVHVDDPILANTIRNHIAEQGVTLGASMSSVDIAAVRMHAIADMEEINQLSLYFDGCIAHIEVQLQQDSSSPPATDPANIVAARDGRVLSMQATVGQPMVKAGEAVVKGDLLVCGAVETDVGVLLKHAAAVIIAQTSHTFEETVSLEELLPQTGRIIRQDTFCVFSLQLPLYSTAVFDETTWTVRDETHFLSIFGTTLPIGITSTVYTEHTEVLTTHTREEAEQLARERLQARALAALGDAVVTDITEQGVWEGDTYRLRAIYDCEEDIAKEIPLLSTIE